MQELLGHNDVKTTMIYTHVTEESARRVGSPLDAILRFPRPREGSNLVIGTWGDKPRLSSGARNKRLGSDVKAWQITKSVSIVGQVFSDTAQRVPIKSTSISATRRSASSAEAQLMATAQIAPTKSISMGMAVINVFTVDQAA